MYLINTKEVKEPDNFSDFRTLQEWGLETQCKLRFPGGCFAADSTAAITDGGGFLSCVEFPDSGASTNRAAVSFSLPDTWNRGEMTVTVSYSASAAGGDYAVQCLWYTTKNGETINSGSTAATDTLSSIGGAWELSTHTFSSVRTVDPLDTFATIRLRRDGADGADTDTGDLCILEATITYEPSRY